MLAGFIFVLTTAPFLSIDWQGLARHARRPGLLALILAWTLLGSPVITALAARVAGLPAPLAPALVVWAASPPRISVPGVALRPRLGGPPAPPRMVAGPFPM